MTEQAVDAFEVREPEQPPEQLLLPLDIRQRVAAVIFTSKHEGPPHVVGVVDDPRFLTVTCTCRAYIGAVAGTNTGCWAMKAVRAMLGAQEVTIDASDSPTR